MESVEFLAANHHDSEKMSEPTPNQKFQIEFTVTEENILGKGMCGNVYKGLWKPSQGIEKIVAVKRIPLHDFLDWKREEHILSELDHPNIVKVFHKETQADKR